MTPYQLYVISIILLISPLGHGSSDPPSVIVTTQACTRTERERNAEGEIHEVSVYPCADAPAGPCIVTRGGNATIQIEFTPKIRLTRGMAKHGFYWQSTVDLPFRGINPNACKFMNCPAEPNVRTTYSATIPLKRSFPTGTYDTKLKITQENTVVICTLFQVKLIAPEGTEETEPAETESQTEA